MMHINCFKKIISFSIIDTIDINYMILFEPFSWLPFAQAIFRFSFSKTDKIEEAKYFQF